jgi:uncharacterized protein (TIGR00255 family)
MTGFGRGEAVGEALTLTVEARSVNHRHLDIALRLPAALGSLEPEARRLIQARLERGRVDVVVQMASVDRRPLQDVRVNTALARRYLDEARTLARAMGLDEAAMLTWLLERPGVIQVEEAAPPDPAGVWPLLAQAMGDALDALIARRTAEGAGLAEALRSLTADLAAQAQAMAARAPLAAARRGARLRERLRALLADSAVDEARVVTEVAVWAEKTDVTEELTRLRVHLDEFALMLGKGGPVGRPLDFLIQELNREVNTIAAKADDLELGQAALAAKGLLEKLREQVQNLE